MDERLLAALRHGFPDCSGMAVGLDRLLMAFTRRQSLPEVLAFPLGQS
jgi:lysyl-tRNA synthetase class 2